MQVMYELQEIALFSLKSDVLCHLAPRAEIVIIFMLNI
jgi:hypothetical protein